jgi:hypothetical protein
MTLWSIFCSPLIFGGDLPSNDAATTALITNEDVINVSQHSHGGHQVLERGNIRVWVADGPNPGERYVAVFNLGERSENVELQLSDIGIAGSVSEVRDLWSHASLGPQRSLRTELKPHASMLYRVTTNSN